jgi:hypothetical protein
MPGMEALLVTQRITISEPRIFPKTRTGLVLGKIPVN